MLKGLNVNSLFDIEHWCRPWRVCVKISFLQPAKKAVCEAERWTHFNCWTIQGYNSGLDLLTLARIRPGVVWCLGQDTLLVMLIHLNIWLLLANIYGKQCKTRCPVQLKTIGQYIWLCHTELCLYRQKTLFDIMLAKISKKQWKSPPAFHFRLLGWRKLSTKQRDQKWSNFNIRKCHVSKTKTH